MLLCKVGNKSKIFSVKLELMNIADVLGDEREFEISVDGQVFFYESMFPILELAQYCQKWINDRNSDFIYNTVESDENPLIAFNRVEGGWKLESVWREFECKKVFSETDVINFVNKIIHQVTH